uniref:Uncharacterized protein n=1 Tax=Rhizophora mucronata TaxID=61149 RepID=A0A2P2IQ89_RHIMU
MNCARPESITAHGYGVITFSKIM